MTTRIDETEGVPAPSPFEPLGTYAREDDAVTTIRQVRQLAAKWVHEDFYTVSKETLHIDSRRECWICGGAFRDGDGMTVACTASGNKTLHTRCYRAQQEAPDAH